MGRRAALLGFWFAGGIIGFLAWLNKTPMLNVLKTLGLTVSVSEALLMAVFGSSLMVLGAMIWSFLSSK